MESRSDREHEEGNLGNDLLDDQGKVLDPLGNPRRNPVPKIGAPAARGDTVAGGDLLAYYLSDVRRHPLLGPEEERSVSLLYYEKGDSKAGERLVTSNLRLVVKIAFQYHRQWSNVLDLIQEGNVGLVEALSRYDPYRAIRFSSYAQYWIRALILRFLMDNFRLVRLGSTRNGRKLFFQLQKERERMLREGLEVTHQKLAERLQVPESEVNAVDQHMRAPAMSLHAPMGEEGRSLAELVPDENTSGPEDNVAGARAGALVQARLREFQLTLEDERERGIWHERLLSDDRASLAELGARFDVSKERIRQIEGRIMRRLKVFLEGAIGAEIQFDFQIPEWE